MNSHREYLKAIEDLNYHTKLYNEGNPIWSDKQWDDLYFELVKYEEETGMADVNSPTQKISYTVVNELKKIQHNHHMASLDKTKDWDEFLKYFGNKDVIGMLKLDGLTCSLRYAGGRLISAETRGNGVIGEDILHNALVIKSIPKAISYMDELIIDGEVICTYSDFEEFSDDYKNPRNFASGSIRLLDSKECSKRNLTFVVWNIVKGFDDSNSFFDKLHKIENLGFKVVPHTSSFDWDAKEFLINKADDLGYPIDGLVGRFDDIAYGTSLGSTAHHAKAAYAFKMYDEEYETTLLSIEYEPSRKGILTPVAIFEPIDIDGSTVEKASVHNLSIMKTILNKPWIGQKIGVFKANAIIPQISWSEEDDGTEKDYIVLPEVCPVCGKPTKIITSDSGIDTLMCGNTDCPGKFINKLDHFCGKSGMDIKGLSKATLEKLMDWGWLNEYADIYKLKDHATEWKNKPSFGIASVSNILNAIEASKNCKFESVISAFGIPLVGRTIGKDLSKHFKNYSDFRKAIEDDFDFTKFDGYGYEMHKALSNFDYTEMDNIVWNYLNLEYPEEKTDTSINDALAGKKVCITGSLKEFKNRAALQAAIEEAGGKAVTSVTKVTDYLINNDATSQSSKNLSAQKLGIPILTEKDFIEKFLKS